MNKVILIVGVLDKMGSTNIGQAEAFLAQGYDVFPINYRTILKTYGPEYLEEYLLHVVTKYKPELVLFSKCNGMNPDLVLKCKEHTKTWLWNMDYIDTIAQCPEVVQHAINADYSSCTSLPTIEYFKELGVSNCHHVIEGLDTDVFKSVPPVDKYKADISFIGTKTPERDAYLDELESSEFDVKFYGPGYNNEVIDKEFSQICASSKFMLSINTYNNIPHYFSDRIIRLLGTGSCVLHLDNTGTMDAYFKDGVEAVYFKDKEDLIATMYEITDEEAGKIAIAGREKVLSTFTWQHSILRILQILNFKGIK